MKIKTKLSLGFVCILMIMSVFIIIISNILSELRLHAEEIVSYRYEQLRLITRVQQGLDRTEVLFYEAVLTGSLQSIANDLEKSRSDTLAAVELLAKTNDNKTVELTSEFKQLYSDYQNNQQQIMKMISDGKRNEAIRLATEDSKIELRLIQKTDELKNMQETNIDVAYDGFQQHYRDSIKLTYTSIIAGILVGLAFAIWFISGFGTNIEKLISGINRIAYGAMPGKRVTELPRLKVTSDDEIMKIASAVNDMAASIEEYMKKEASYIETVEAQNWLMTSVAEISTVYQGVQETQTLGSVIIDKLTRVLDAGYGAFYILQTEGVRQILRKLASYAHDGSEVGTESFILGEGLVGQCAKENKSILVDNVPKEYIKIKSGLGETGPSSLVIIPIEFENRVVGVMEFATLKEFSELHFTLLDMVAGNIGITLSSVMNHVKIQRLLGESKALTEELQTQSEELQTQQEELRSVNEELQEQNRTSEERALELEKARALLEEQTKELSLISQYKSDFLANMSHELRTPLNSLLILSQMLKENEEGNLNAQQLEYVATIYSAGNELLGLINNVLDLSKIESGKMVINPTEAEMSDIVSYTRNQFNAIAKKKGIEFFVRASDELPETIFTDDLKLKQILSNLISNAIKFTEKGSVVLDISIADKRKTLNHQSLRNVDGILAFSVSDTGIGIPQDKIDMIFEAFEQADGTTSRKFGGTGLGLSISKELAGILGGFVTVESQEGKGSLFTLYIPSRIGNLDQHMLSEKEIAIGADLSMISAKEPEFELDTEESGEKIKPRLDTALLKGKKVLIVDDDMRNIFALTTALEKHEMNVQFAETGVQAIEFLNNNPDVDLVLMDLMMPELDGYETIKRIRLLPGFKVMPIIAVTAKAMKNDKQKCIDAGASDYICKPVNIEQLYSLMLVWLYS